MIDKSRVKECLWYKPKNSDTKEDFGKCGKSEKASLPLPRRAEEETQVGQNIITQMRELNSACLHVGGPVGTEASTL